MSSPIELPPLTTEIDLEFERNCNCVCCHTYVRSKQGTPSKDETGKSRGRTFSLWTAKSDKQLPVATETLKK